MAAGDPVSAELRNSIKSLIEEDRKLRVEFTDTSSVCWESSVPTGYTSVTSGDDLWLLRDGLCPGPVPRLHRCRHDRIGLTLLCAGLARSLRGGQHLARSSRGSFRAPSRKTVVLSLVGAGGLALLALAVGALGLHMTISNIQDVAHQFRGAYNCETTLGSAPSWFRSLFSSGREESLVPVLLPVRFLLDYLLQRLRSGAVTVASTADRGQVKVRRSTSRRFLARSTVGMTQTRAVEVGSSSPAPSDALPALPG